MLTHPVAVKFVLVDRFPKSLWSVRVPSQFFSVLSQILYCVQGERQLILQKILLIIAF